MQELGALLPFVAIALLFWLLIIRPASKRQKAMVRMQSSVSLGDEVVLTSGVYGRVAALEDSVLHLTVADGVTIKVARGAIGSVVPPEDEAPSGEASTDESVSDGPKEN